MVGNFRVREPAPIGGVGKITLTEVDKAVLVNTPRDSDRQNQGTQQFRRRRPTRRLWGVKEKIQDAAGVRKTRSGHMLIEIIGQATASEVTEKLNSAIGQKVEIVMLLNKSTLELKNIESPYY